MKRLRILPDAAGIIALTAAIGFIDGQRETKAEDLSIEKIALLCAKTKIMTITAGGALPGNQPNNKSDILAYMIEIRRGDKHSNVLIDAVTGRVLL